MTQTQFWWKWWKWKPVAWRVTKLQVRFLASNYYHRLLCLHNKRSDSELADPKSLQLTEKLILTQDYLSTLSVLTNFVYHPMRWSQWASPAYRWVNGDMAKLGDLLVWEAGARIQAICPRNSFLQQYLRNTNEVQVPGHSVSNFYSGQHWSATLSPFRFKTGLLQGTKEKENLKEWDPESLRLKNCKRRNKWGGHATKIFCKTISWRILCVAV